MEYILKKTHSLHKILIYDLSHQIVRTVYTFFSLDLQCYLYLKDKEYKENGNVPNASNLKKFKIPKSTVL